MSTSKANTGSALERTADRQHGNHSPLASRLGVDVEAASSNVEHDIRESLTLFSHENAAKSLKAKSKRDIDLYRKRVDVIENE
ncbi:hypothetical protein EC957_005487 [Mortierella hygrophila]|uniref:Uncharacterized protein n=1 Tax=Mortierella hygrophila TaxID=979708 RepID=A0A9P6FDH4_9FUNG|nr:hypothetical protein EC957_005487 [Mortierella hygrophila]